MKGQPIQLKPLLLIGSMIVLALCINFHFLGKVEAKRIQETNEQESRVYAVEAKRLQYVKEQEKQARIAEEKKAAQDAAVKHAEYVARYVSGGFAPKTGNRNVAVAAATEDGKLDRAVTTTLTRRFQKTSASVLSPFFNPEFVSDGLFQEAFNGSSTLFRKLDLANSLDGLVLAQQDVQYAQNAALENVISATMQLKVTLIPISSPGNGQTWIFTASGPGFTKEVARKAAEERLIKQITNDTNMSLDALP
jgi:hypothetical protein